eukprot:TRINITY_DN16787_c0_g1_i1.p1 TRINITY_DN16787_c0_g1~~TRINITY_DN16787_c0_g1_i1.p1  ORF type:complete len:391 (+),score=30.93 TRINITY_DN16787_c0_g1_i1:144-1316(+)
MLPSANTGGSVRPSATLYRVPVRFSLISYAKLILVLLFVVHIFVIALLYVTVHTHEAASSVFDVTTVTDVFSPSSRWLSWLESPRDLLFCLVVGDEVPPSLAPLLDQIACQNTSEFTVGLLILRESSTTPTLPSRAMTSPNVTVETLSPQWSDSASLQQKLGKVFDGDVHQSELIHLIRGMVHTAPVANHVVFVGQTEVPCPMAIKTALYAVAKGHALYSKQPLRTSLPPWDGIVLADTNGALASVDDPLRGDGIVFNVAKFPQVLSVAARVRAGLPFWTELRHALSFSLLHFRWNLFAPEHRFAQQCWTQVAMGGAAWPDETDLHHPTLSPPKMVVTVDDSSAYFIPTSFPFSTFFINVTGELPNRVQLARTQVRILIEDSHELAGPSL